MRRKKNKNKGEEKEVGGKQNLKIIQKGRKREEKERKTTSKELGQRSWASVGTVMVAG